MRRAIMLVLAVIFGLAAGFMLLTTIELVSYLVLALRSGIHWTNEAAIQEVINEGRVPLESLVLVLAGFLLAPPVGGLSAAFMLKTDRVLAAVIVGGLFFLATIQQLTAVAHPQWFNVASLIGIPTVVWLAIQRIQMQEIARRKNSAV